MENLAPVLSQGLDNGAGKPSQTLTVIITVALVISAVNGLITFIRFLEEREIAREKMRSLKDA